MSIQTKVDSFFKKEFNKQPSFFIAPGRINMIGEHTDYNDGFVMPTAIDKHFVFAIAPSGSELFTVHALDPDEKKIFSFVFVYFKSIFIYIIVNFIYCIYQSYFIF